MNCSSRQTRHRLLSHTTKRIAVAIRSHAFVRRGIAARKRIAAAIDSDTLQLEQSFPMTSSHWPESANLANQIPRSWPIRFQESGQ